MLIDAYRCLQMSIVDYYGLSNQQELEDTWESDMIQLGCLMSPLSVFGFIFIWMVFVHDISGQLHST